jgi:hypothetical protein
MSYVLTQFGAKRILNTFFNDLWPTSGKDLTLHLFVNNYIPTIYDVVTNYVEASGGGYQSLTLYSGGWSINNFYEIDYPIQVFTFGSILNGSNIIFGYYITDIDQTLILAERCNPFTAMINGNQYNVVLKFLLNSLPNN